MTDKLSTAAGLITMITALFTAAGSPAQGQVKSPEAGFPRIGISARGDVVNAIGAPGIKLWLVDNFEIDAYYMTANDMSGYAVRAILIPSVNLRTERFSIRPYVGVGYVSLEKDITESLSDINLSSSNDIPFLFNQTFPVETTFSANNNKITVTAEGSGLNVFAGLRTNPFQSLRNLYIEIEFDYAFFDVKFDGTGETEITTVIHTPLGDVNNTTPVEIPIKTSADLKQSTLIVGVTYYF